MFSVLSFHDHSEVTIISLEENAKSPLALGILSSTARTFVQGGTTTEFSTHVLGTTIGKTYARLLSTGSRVFYDNSRPASREKTKPTDAFLVFPTLLQYPSLDSERLSPSEPEEILQTKSFTDEQKVQEIISNHEAFNSLTLDELFDLSDTKQNVQKVLLPNGDDRENVVSVRKEYSVKRNSDVKPAKVKSNNDLPTYTVRQEFAPSGFSLEAPEEKKEEIVKPGKRNGKALFRGGLPVKQEKKLDTVTYFGFADFTTTVGDTVIVFMPKTPNPQIAGAVTSIQGEATLRPEDAAMPVVTSVKTFMSHSPGMATKTVTGHSLSMHTSLPTVLADPAVRESKAYEPIYTPSRPDGDSHRFGFQPLDISVQPSMDSDINVPSVTATEPLLSFATTTTQIYNSAENALGLVKSIGGTEAYEGTTTVFTSFVVGTVIDGAYKQLTQSASSVFINVDGKIITTTGVGINIAPTSTSEVSKSIEPEGTMSETSNHTPEEHEITTEGEVTTSENELSNEVETARKINSLNQDQMIVAGDSTPNSKDEFITRIVPSTVYKTFTYLTTFFIPDNTGGQTTSIRSREVTSEDVSYVTKLIDVNEPDIISSTIAPSEVSTESIPTTTHQEITTVTEEVTESTTPQLVVTNPDVLTTPEQLTTTELEVEDEKTTPSPTPKPQVEEEVDLIFKTLYTTYTYLTTFFEESSTSVSSREVVVTNIITTTLDNMLASDPAVAGLFNKNSYFPSASDILGPAPTSVGIGRPTTKYFEDSQNVHDDDLFTSTLESVDLEKELQTPTPALDSVNEITEEGLKSFYTTYTYFTTVFVDGETEVESRTEVYTNVLNTNSQLSAITPTSQIPLFSSDYVSVLPDEQVESPEDLTETNQIIPLKSAPTRLYDSTISRFKVKENEIAPLSEALMKENGIKPTNIDNAYKYDTTMSRGHSTEQNQDVDEEKLMSARQKELSKEEKLLLGINPSEDLDVEEKIVVDVTSSSSGRSRKVYRESYDDPDDQITSESNTEEIEPSFSPTILLQTSYTTFTYFTTVYKGTSSNVVSRLDTVTNVVTETLSPSDIETSLSPEEATLPITYFTTFTYWTTLYKDGNTMVTSREETISTVVAQLTSTDTFDITPTEVTSLVLPTVLTSVVGENAADSPVMPKKLEPVTTESLTDFAVITPSPTSLDLPFKDSQIDKEASLKNSSSQDLDPTTFYTTYTYFTTSYIGNSTVLNSRLETITNIVTPTAEVTEPSTTTTLEPTDDDDENSLNVTQKIDGPVLKPTGLISTIRTSEVINGITTLLSTDVFGTYIDGLYAQVLESSTQIVSPSVVPASASAVNGDSKPTGVVSINEGKIVDADGVSTTFFTTKAIGTYIDKLYAQVIESTTSVQVDEERKTATQLLDPSTTIVGSKTYRTGLVRLIEGSIIKDKTTTFYESRVVGTLIEGRYAQIIESTSSFKIAMTPTPVPDILATKVSNGNVAITPTATASSSPSPAVIESSIGENEEDELDENENEDDDDNKGRSKSRLSFSSRKKTFTPVIRPFASRPRPTFLPKKKTGDVGSATTITRNVFTPTITATPAVKSSDRGFGSSRNRFAGGRRSSSSNVIVPTASVSTGRRFAGRRGSSTVSVSVVPSSSNYRGRSTARVVSPTASSSFASSSKRGSFNYRTSTGPRSSLASSGNSRFRIRPTLSTGRPVQTVASTTEDIVNTNDIGGVTVVTEESLVTVQDEEEETSPPSTTTTTTESPRRNNNPLLRFRRPPILQRSSTTTTTPKPTTSSSRKNNLLRRPDNRGTTTTPISPTRSRPAPTFPPRNRQRTSNNLFPPRGLVRKPTPAEEAEEEENKEDKIDENTNAKLDEENEFSDNDYEGSEQSESKQSTKNETTTTVDPPKTDRRGRLINPVQIKPFQGVRRPRTKRQAVEWGARSYRGSRYQKPTSRPTSFDYYADDSEPLPSETPTTRTPARFKPRSREPTQTNQHNNQYNQQGQYNQQSQHNQHSQSRVRPTKASTTSERAQFTLRDKSSSQSVRSNFKRPTTSRRRPTTIETTSAPQRPKPPRLRTQASSQQDTAHTSRNSGRRYSNSRRTTTRSRYRDSTDYDSHSFSSSFDGTITVTHQIPTEVTIPVVNGKVTEYKNVITAKPSLEVLGPYQYTTTTGKLGNVLIQLTSEITSTLPNGIMEVTKFLVYETPTTSITFTPTTLRGRKTSFSHIVPSTVYDVKAEVSTVQPQIAANAPLANLLLSQLLLGNLNLQPNGQPLNPLLGLQNQQIAPPTPTTEFKTKTTTYVTTVTDHTSTVLPLTFRGKEILTTIVDSSTQVITATEYITETVVITPTAALGTNPQQINSLLLPALLQAQLLQPQPPTVNPLLGNAQQPILPQDILNIQDDKLQLEEPAQRFKKRKPVENDDDSGRLSQEAEFEEILEQPKLEQKTRKKIKVKSGNKKPPDVPPPIAETSVITLYVSGRKPGDFSTILSTVTLGDESSVTVRKREVEYVFDDLSNYQVEASKTPELGGSFPSQEDDYNFYYVMPAINEVAVEGSEIETESLESIVGDVSKYLTSDHYKFNTDYKMGKPSKINDKITINKYTATLSKSIENPTGHFLSKSPAENAPSQRTGQNNFDWSNKTIKYADDKIFLGYSKSLRVKRQTDETPVDTPKRRRVRVRVPIQRRVIIDEELDPSEAQRSHDIAHQELLQTQDFSKKDNDFGTRKIKVIRKRPKSENFEQVHNFEEPTYPVRRRVAVRKRPASSVVYENYFSQTQQGEVNNNYNIQPSESFAQETPEIFQTTSFEQAEPVYRRKKVLVTRKIPIAAPPTLETTPVSRRKVVVTRRRPVIKSEVDPIEPATIFSNFFAGLQTDYDYLNSPVDTELEDTNYDVNDYRIEDSKQIRPVTEESDIQDIPDDDSIKIPSWHPENQAHSSLNKFPGVKVKDSDNLESIVWFYEPAEGILVDLQPTLSDEAFPQVTKSSIDNTDNFGYIAESTKDAYASLSVTQHAELSSVEIDNNDDLEVTDKLEIVSSTESHPEPISPAAEEETGQENSTEEKIEFENPPKYVRPTRFSITRKPSRTITGYPGTRRRQSTQVIPTPVSTLETFSTPSYKARKPSKQYDDSLTLSSIATEDLQSTPINTLETAQFEIDSKNILMPSDIYLAASVPDDIKDSDQSVSTTPSLSESTLPFEHIPSSELPEAIPTSYITTVVTSTRLRTYTYVVTRVSGDESIVTSSTSVKPKVNTLTLTIPVLAYSTAGES